VNAGMPIRQGRILRPLTSPELGGPAPAISRPGPRDARRAALERKRGLASEDRSSPRGSEAESQAAEARAALDPHWRPSVLLTACRGSNGPAASTSLAVAASGSVIERTAVVGQMLDPATPTFESVICHLSG
jgi:hypothetical protein